MFFTAALVALSAVPNILALTINTPTNAVVCQPTLMSWADATAPVYITVIPGGQVGAAPLKTFPPQTGTSLTWIVDIAAGTSVTLALKDNTGATAYTQAFTIGTNSDTSCLNASSSTSDTAAPIGATVTPGTQVGAATTTTTVPPVTGTTVTGGVTTATSVRPASSAATSATRTTSQASASATHSSAAIRSYTGNFGLVGLLSLVGAVLM